MIKEITNSQNYRTIFLFILLFVIFLMLFDRYKMVIFIEKLYRCLIRVFNSSVQDFTRLNNF